MTSRIVYTNDILWKCIPERVAIMNVGLINLSMCNGGYQTSGTKFKNTLVLVTANAGCQLCALWFTAHRLIVINEPEPRTK